MRSSGHQRLRPIEPTVEAHHGQRHGIIQGSPPRDGQHQIGRKGAPEPETNRNKSKARRSPACRRKSARGRNRPHGSPRRSARSSGGCSRRTRAGRNRPQPRRAGTPPSPGPGAGLGRTAPDTGKLRNSCASPTVHWANQMRTTSSTTSKAAAIIRPSHVTVRACRSSRWKLITTSASARLIRIEIRPSA